MAINMTSPSIKKALLNIFELVQIGNVDKIFNNLVTAPDLSSKSDDYLSKLTQSARKDTTYYSRVPDGIVTKNQLQNLRPQFLSRRRLAGQYLNSSGGSTGSPVSFVQDREYRAWCRATEKYYFTQFLGIDYDRTRKIVLWGSERDTLKQKDPIGMFYNWLSNTVFLNSFNLSADKMAEYVKTINRVKPVFIKGYAGSLYEMAKYIKQNNLSLPPIKFIYSAAEQLRDFMRKEIESVFKCKVYNFYGSREAGPIAGECYFSSMHVFNFHNRIEIIDFKSNQSVPIGRDGRIVVTNLHNYSMPLIRYEIGDTGSLSLKVCKCGSKLPVLRNITGRITDHFINSRGDLIHGEFFTHLFYHRPWIKKFQVVQDVIDHIDVYFIPVGKVNNKMKQEIEDKIISVMGGSYRVTWHSTNSIKTSAQGKYLYTKSLLQH